MSDDIENYFIENFIVKSKRDRLLFELNGKKRKIGIARFFHNADEMLLKEKLIVCGYHLHYEEIVKTIESYGLSEEWYIVAFNQNIDKVSCNLKEALDLVLGNGMAAIIISDTMAIVETEQSTGTPSRYILHN